MIPVPSTVRVWLAVGRTDMRRGMNGLALQVQETLKRDPHAGDLFVFRGRSGDMIKIIWHDGLALQVQEALKRDPHAGDLFVFRGRRGDMIKIIWHDGLGMSLYAKRLEKGRFIWPSPADGVVAISAAQLAYMLEGRRLVVNPLWIRRFIMGARCFPEAAVSRGR